MPFPAGGGDARIGGVGCGPGTVLVDGKPGVDGTIGRLDASENAPRTSCWYCRLRNLDAISWAWRRVDVGPLDTWLTRRRRRAPAAPRSGRPWLRGAVSTSNPRGTTSSRITPSSSMTWAVGDIVCVELGQAPRTARGCRSCPSSSDTSSSESPRRGVGDVLDVGYERAWPQVKDRLGGRAPSGWGFRPLARDQCREGRLVAAP